MPNVVVQWNRILLVIVRTLSAQPATIHSTRSFAIVHAAIYDAVNAIDSAPTGPIWMALAECLTQPSKTPQLRLRLTTLARPPVPLGLLRFVAECNDLGVRKSWSSASTRRFTTSPGNRE